MTKKKLRRVRQVAAVNRYFTTLDRTKVDLTKHRKMQSALRALPECRGNKPPGEHRSRHRPSKAMRRFRARLAFYGARTAGKWLSPREFIQRPYFDELLGRPSGYVEYTDEATGTTWYAAINRSAHYGTRPLTAAAAGRPSRHESQHATGRRRPRPQPDHLRDRAVDIPGRGAA